MGNFLEDFLFGRPDPRTGEVHGGIPAVADTLWPLENTWVSSAIDSTAGRIVTAPVRTQLQMAQTGLAGLEAAFSYGLYRPLSTAIQAGATPSAYDTRTYGYAVHPLYRDGLQFQDFIDMWNASEYITPMRALSQWSWYRSGGAGTPIGPSADPEGVALNKALTNPYPTAGGMRREDYERAWDNSVLATVVSGTGDAAVGFIGIPGLGRVASAGKSAAGLQTTIQNARDVNALRTVIEGHEVWRSTGGKQGKWNVSGQHVEDLAKETDIYRIMTNPMLDRYTGPGSFNRDNLALRISEIDDAATIRELVLADRGDTLALGRLFQAAPDHVWSLTDMNEKLARQFSAGGQYFPTADTARVINATFDTAAQRDEWWSSVRDMFMSGRIDEPLQDVGRTVPTVDNIPVTSARGQRLTQLNDDLVEANRRFADAEQEIALRNTPEARQASEAALEDVKRIEAEIESVRSSQAGVDELDTTVPLSSDAGRLTAVRGPGSDFVPMGTFASGPVGAIAGTAESWLKSTVANARINKPNQWLEIPLGPKGPKPLTTLLFWTGSRQPLNIVSYTRLRPTEIVDEMLSYSRSSRALRKRSWLVSRTDARTGEPVQVSMQDWQWRAEAADRLVRAKSQGDVALDETVRTLQEELISVVVNRYGLTPQDATDVSKGLNQWLNDAQEQVARDGFFWDDALGRATPDPSFVRQLPSSRILMPLDDLDWALRGESSTRYARRGRATRRVMRTSADLLDFLFKIFRTNVLFKPGYTPKNSFGEPGVSSFLADGSIIAQGGLRATLKRFEINNDRRMLQLKYGVMDRLPFVSPARRDANAMQRLADEYATLSSRLDELDAHIDDLADASPAVRSQWLNAARTERRTLGRQLKSVEDELSLGDPAWTDVIEIPNYTELSDRVASLRSALLDDAFPNTATARITELESIGSQRLATGERATSASGLTAVEAEELAQLRALLTARTKIEPSRAQAIVDDFQAQLDSIRRETQVVSPDARSRANALREQLTALDQQRATLSGRIAKRRLSRERLRKREFSGEEDYVKNIGGVDYLIPAPFAQVDNYGTALRAEASADISQAQTLTGGVDPLGLSSTRQLGLRWSRMGSGVDIKPMDPRYWDELAYIYNRHIMGDEFANLLLSRATDMKIIEWFNRPAGKAYAKRMGWTREQIMGGPAGSVKASRQGKGPDTGARITLLEDGVIAENRRILDQYFPDPAFRRRLLENRELTPGELQEALGSRTDLAPIYGPGLQFEGNIAARVNRALNNALDVTWKNLASKPESRFARWPFFTREYERQMERMIRIRQDQGLMIEGADIIAMRQVAQARALKETENTFYNIRRMTNPVFAQRYLVGFAAAAWNSLYRYMRLAYRNPGRAMVTAWAWTSLLQNVGVDDDGNKVEDWKDAKSILVSVPSFIDAPISPDIRVSTDTFNFATQRSSYVPIVQMSVGTLLTYKPDMQEWIKENFPDVAEELFRYGTSTDPALSILGVPLDPATSSYQRRLLTYFRGQSDDEFLQSAELDWNYQLFEWTRGGQKGPMPRFEDSAQNASDFYLWSAGIAAMTSGVTGLSPDGQFYRDEARRVMDKYPDDYNAYVAEMYSLYGDAAYFLTGSTSSSRSAMPPTVDAYRLLGDNEELAKDLLNMSTQNPKLTVDLLFLDEMAYKQEDYADSVYNYQFRNPLPGDDQTIRDRPSSVEIEREVQKARSWAMWNASVAAKDAALLQLGKKTLSPQGATAVLYQQWNTFVDDFKSDPQHSLMVEELGLRKTETTGIALRAMGTLLRNRNFMSSAGNSVTYQTMKTYYQELGAARLQFDDLQTPDERKAFAEQWDSYVRDTYLPGAGNFSMYYERYLAGRDLTIGEQMLDRDLSFRRFPLITEDASVG